MALLFVYGTLKRGHHNHRVLGDADFKGNASMYGRMLHLGGFPGVIDDPYQQVHGELYEVTNFNRLDMLEGYDVDNHEGMYLREQRIVYPDTGPMERTHAWVYLWNRDVEGRKVIESGVWE